MTLRVTILGCGSSAGVPRLGSGWGACDPANPKNRRRRCSILVERLSGNGTTSVLVDTSPDLREQLLEAGLAKIDAVLFTHDHADHTHGIDDLRPLAMHMRKRVPAYMAEATRAVLFARFGYCFESPPDSVYPPILDGHAIAACSPVSVKGEGGPLAGQPFRMVHGDSEALGFRFETVAYAPDVSYMPEESLPYLRGLDVLIIDALRYKPHPTHYSVADALALIDEVKPRRAILTNLATDLDYDALRRQVPAHVEPAFDGMQLTVG